jgi:hypothetical protein
MHQNKLLHTELTEKINHQSGQIGQLYVAFVDKPSSISKAVFYQPLKGFDFEHYKLDFVLAKYTYLILNIPPIL